MNNRALIGLSAAAMSALVATAVGCGEPQQKTYTPAEEPAATVEAPATTEAETTETEAAEPEATEAEKAEETTEAEGEKAEEAAPAEETTEAEAEAEKTDEAPASDAAYTDGEYTAEGKGIGGTVPVTVTVKDGKIAEVTVGDNSETQGIGSKAIEQLPEAIVAANGTEGVDAVSGATVTSKAIFSAVDEALAQAQGGAEAAEQSEEAAPAADDAKAEETAEPAADEEKAEEAAPAEQAAPAEAGALTDGSYTAEGKGIGGKVPVTVEVKDGKIATVTVGDNSETQGIGSKAIEQLPEAIVAANGTEGVDAVSGATVTSKAIFSAVDEALEQAKGGAAAEQAAPAEDAKADEKAEPAAEEKAEDAKADEKADDKAADAKADEKAEPAAEEKAEDAKADEKAEDAKADDKAADAKADEKAEPAADEKAEEAKADTKDEKATDTKDAKADDKKADEKDAKDDKAAEGYADGEYTAEGKGIGGKVPVTVTVKDGKVSDVKVGDNSETQGIGSKAIEQLPAKIVEANGLEGVDAVSGATVTSKAIFTAVEDCLKQAAPAADAKADKADKAEAGALKDGDYTAEGKGIGGKVPVTVTVKDGKVSEVTVGDNSETQGIGSKAIEQLPAKIVEANGTEGVDAVSGATVTSKAIFTAVEDCLEQAK